MMRLLRFGFAFAAVLVWGGAQARAADLIYFGSVTCSVCERWDEEVGGIYPKTDEARRLPLRYQSVHDDPPQDLAFIKGVVYTPTFVAVENGREVGRIVGYMGDFFFWQQVDALIGKLKPTETAPRSAACTGGAPAQAQQTC